MKRYVTLRKKIDKLTKSSKNDVAPMIAYLDKIDNGHELRISFWNGKENSGDKMPLPLKFQFSKYEDAEEFLLNYLKDNKPYNNFVLFTNEEDIYE